MLNVYLDVDGVLKPEFRALEVLPGMTGFRQYAMAKAGASEVVYAPELIAQINDLAKDPRVNFVWLSTWDREAPEVLCPAIGLHGHNWPVLTGDHDLWCGPDWWKLRAIREDMECCRPRATIWVDDDLRSSPEATAWADSQPSMLWLSPETNLGMSASMWGKVLEKVAEVLK